MVNLDAGAVIRYSDEAAVRLTNRNRLLTARKPGLAVREVH